MEDPSLKIVAPVSRKDKGNTEKWYFTLLVGRNHTRAWAVGYCRQ